MINLWNVIELKDSVLYSFLQIIYSRCMKKFIDQNMHDETSLNFISKSRGHSNKNIGSNTHTTFRKLNNVECQNVRIIKHPHFLPPAGENPRMLRFRYISDDDLVQKPAIPMAHVIVSDNNASQIFEGHCFDCEAIRLN